MKSNAYKLCNGQINIGLIHNSKQNFFKRYIKSSFIETLKER